jgi:transposase-like protein
METQYFEKYKALQYCTNTSCKYLNQIGSGNICTACKQRGQVYCNGCSSRWVITKDTFFFGLRSNQSLIISVLKDLSEGMGRRAVERTSGVCMATQNRWILRAAEHIEVISAYLEKDIHLDRVQIDEFWSYIFKKKSVLAKRKNL